MRASRNAVLPALVWVRSLPPWGMVGRSPLPCDANCLNAQKNGSARAAASRAAADLVAEPPQLLPTRDPEEPHSAAPLPARCRRTPGLGRRGCATPARALVATDATNLRRYR